MHAPPLTSAPWIAVREVMSPPGTTLPLAAPVSEAVAALLNGGSDRLWLTDPQGRLVGEVTDAALLRAEVRGVPGERPIASLADPVEPADGTADAAEAVVRLGRGGEVRVPVTEGGVLIGELTRADALGLVHGIRRVAGAAAIPLPVAEDRPAESIGSVGPAAPRFLSRRAGATRAATVREREGGPETGRHCAP